MSMGKGEGWPSESESAGETAASLPSLDLTFTLDWIDHSVHMAP